MSDLPPVDTEPTAADMGWDEDLLTGHVAAPEEIPAPAPPREPAAQETPSEPLPVFDERFRDDFEGLLFLGKLTHSFSWMGHDFVIRTLTVDEILEIGLIHKRYVGTMGEIKAYQAAVVAASLVTADRHPLAVPLTNDPHDTVLQAKFDYVRRSWFPPVVDVLYEQYVALEKRMYDVMEAMGKA